MKRATVAWILKAVLILTALGVLLAAGVFLPMYMKHVAHAKPELAFTSPWVIAYGWLLALPVFVCFVLLWRVFGTIATGEAFCKQNALRFTRIWQLALFDLALVLAMAVFLFINQALPLFLIFTLSMLAFLGVAVGSVTFALSGLVSNAAQLAEDDKMTI